MSILTFVGLSYKLTYLFVTKILVSLLKCQLLNFLCGCFTLMHNTLRIFRSFMNCYDPLNFAALEVCFSDFWGTPHDYHLTSVCSAMLWKDFIAVSSFLVGSYTLDRATFFLEVHHKDWGPLGTSCHKRNSS